MGVQNSFAKRTKRGGYSWSVREVRAMLRSIIMRREGRSNYTVDREIESKKKQTASAAGILIRQLIKKPQEFTTGVI